MWTFLLKDLQEEYFKLKINPVDIIQIKIINTLITNILLVKRTCIKFLNIYLRSQENE